MPSPQTLTYTTNNQITGYRYDADGNVTDDGTNRYRYDAENRLCAVYNYTGNGAMTGYAYGAEGYRLAKGTIASFLCDFTKNGFSPTNYYAVGPNGEQLDETDENYVALHANVFMNGRVLATYSAGIDSNWHFSFNDWLGTRRVQQNAYQVTEGTFLSLPFGDNLTLTGNPGATESSSPARKETRIRQRLLPGTPVQLQYGPLDDAGPRVALGYEPDQPAKLESICLCIE